MTPMVTINRLGAGAPGLDAVLGGGPPEFSFNLIAGPSGCGTVGLVSSRAPDLSLHELLLDLLSEVRRLKATRVVVDSTSGLELAMAPTCRSDFRESLSPLVAALAAEGVTLLMTSELEDRYTDHEQWLRLAR